MVDASSRPPIYWLDHAPVLAVGIMIVGGILLIAGNAGNNGGLASSTGGLVCGDGARSASEQCDGSDLGGATCESEGLSGGTLRCSSSCSFDYSSCYA